MSRRLLDTDWLIRQWRLRATGPLSAYDISRARGWAHELIQLLGTDAIVTPVYIEFVAGVLSQHELILARAYLAEFRIVDGGSVLPEDWLEARRLAERVPRKAKRRQLGDCLIRAIARRLKHDVVTCDTGFPM